MRKLISETDYADVLHDSSVKIGIIIWKRKTSLEEYKNAFIKLLSYAENHPADFFMSDITKQSVVSPEGRKWFETDMLPKAIKLGLKKAATITDGNVFKKYYVNMIIKSTNKFGLPLKLFGTEEEAINWFKK
ncbi:MAG: hypothetical protein U9R54_03475 [Bacteroidota bacterium]|nr:hypothetical protein [Bacteroidota bacterium]